tara:strand:+ start:2858 stop:3148 length:291 start_codon:yes stop_codon:yes gene_type:complete
MNLTIQTNNHYRETIDWFDIPDKVKPDFDYLDDPEQANFFKYRGRYYELGQFMRIEHHPDTAFSSWDDYHSDSAFSGILVKYSSCGDGIKCATYYS